LNAPTDWWKTFFDGLAVGFWRAAVPPEATRADADFLWKHLNLARGARVLDVPCGSGRLTLALAARGCAMLGVDISSESVDAAAADASEQGLAVDFRCADMRDLPGSAQFDAVFCFGNSFGYLDDAGNEAFVAAAAAALSPGGRIAIDFGQTAEGVFPRLEPRLEGELCGYRFLEETRFDPVTSRIENVFEFSKDGRTERKLASQRVYLAGDLVRMLGRAGLRVIGLYGSPAEEPFALSSHRLLIVAEKPRPSGRGKRG
jgi:SAM-dependent methyltransferase